SRKQGNRARVLPLMVRSTTWPGFEAPQRVLGQRGCLRHGYPSSDLVHIRPTLSTFEKSRANLRRGIFGPRSHRHSVGRLMGNLASTNMGEFSCESRLRSGPPL